MSTQTAELAALLAKLAHALADDGQRPAPAHQPRQMPERVLLTAEEAAERLNIGRTLMWRLIRSGQIESVTIGRLRRIPASAVFEYAQRLVSEQSGQNAA